MKKKTILLIIGVLLLIDARADQASLASRGKADVVSAHAELIKDLNHSYSIKFVIDNNGASDIDLFESYLPWRSQLALNLVAIPLTWPSGPVPSIIPLEDPTMNRVILKAGGEISGEIKLRYYFPRLGVLLEKSDVAVFWSFQIVDMPMSDRYGRFSGFFILPRNGLHHDK